MNLQTIKQIPFKEKKLLTTEACLMYIKLKNINNREIDLSKKVSDSIREGNLMNAKTYSIMESVFGLLEGEHALIIENDFIKRVNPNWYMGNWSKSTYYRLKHEAIDQFLFLLYA